MLVLPLWYYILPLTNDSKIKYEPQRKWSQLCGRIDFKEEFNNILGWGTLKNTFYEAKGY